MKKSEAALTAFVAGVVVAGAADIVIHREKIRLSMLGQENHFATKDRGTFSRMAHALASQTATGRALNWAFHQVTPRLESESE